MDEVGEVVWMARGAWVSLSLRATCELGIVDVLDAPRSLADIAERTSTDPQTLGRLLRVLVDIGLVAVDDDHYVATPRGAVLRTGHPSGVRNLVLMQTVIPNLTAWQHLADATRRGGAVYEELNGMTPWARLAAHPDDGAIFNASMARRSALQVAAIRATRDLTGTRLIIDVGGGEGAMLAGLLHDQPATHGIVADMPAVAAAATTALASAGLGERARGESADFFSSVPTGGDVYVLSNVLHDWDDAAATTILRIVRAAMSPDASLLVVENVLDAPGRTPDQNRDLHLVDLHMLVMFGGRERTKAQYDILLAAAGFAESTLGTSPNIWNVLETHPALPTDPTKPRAADAGAHARLVPPDNRQRPTCGAPTPPRESRAGTSEWSPDVGLPRG